MNEPTTASGSRSIRISLDQEILHNLIHGPGGEAPSADTFDRESSLREHLIYCLMRDMISQFNSRLKGRRERFKLVDEGDGLVIEFSQ